MASSSKRQKILSDGEAERQILEWIQNQDGDGNEGDGEELVN